MAWSAPPTAVTGSIATASDQNILRDDLLWLKDPGNIVLTRVAKAVADSPYTVPGWGYRVDVAATGGAVTVVLPTAVGYDGALIEVRKTDSSANAVTVDGSAAQTINGAATLVIYSQYDSYSFRSDGTNVVIV